MGVQEAACATWRPAVAGVSLAVAAGLAVGGCGSNASSSVASCFAKHAAAGQVSGTPAATAPGATGNPAVAAAWTLPGGNLQNTRDVASPITSSDVAQLGVAWCVPVESTGLAKSAGLADGYATTPVVVHGVVYTQDLESNVMAIRLATGKVLWTHNYSSPNGGPDGVNVVGGTVYAATNRAAVALSAATGRQLWRRTLIGNDREGIDMAPGYNRRHGVRVDRAGQPDRRPVSRRRQVDPVGAERPDRRAGVELGRGAEPVGETSPQLRRRPVGSALVRQRRQYLHRYRQPGPDRPGPVAPRLSVGDKPARPGPLHRLGGQAEPAGQAAVVLPADPARPLRLGPAEFAGPHDRPRAAGGHRRRQGRRPDRAQRADRQAALEAPGRRAHRARERRAAHRARHADLTHPAAREVHPRARRVRRRRIPAGLQRVGDLRRRQQPRRPPDHRPRPGGKR